MGIAYENQPECGRSIVECTVALCSLDGKRSNDIWQHQIVVSKFFLGNVVRGLHRSNVAEHCVKR